HPLNCSIPDELDSGLEVRSSDGRVLSTGRVLGAPLGLALAGKYAAILAQPASSDERRLYVVDARTAQVGRTLTVPSNAAAPVSASGARAVFAAGRTIRLVDLASGQMRVLAKTRGPVVGVAISGRRVTWAENDGKRGRIRTLSLAS